MLKWEVTLKATSYSTIFDIPMRPVHEDQRHRRLSRDGNYSFELCPFHAAHAWRSLSDK